MSLTKEILRITARYSPLGYSQLYKYIYKEDLQGRKIPNKNSLYTTLSRMKRNGLLKRTKEKWTITPEGAELLNSKNQKQDIKRFFPKTKGLRKNIQKQIIAVFDIPEKKRRYRDWLRSELVGFGFDPIQKSVWFGPTLPEEFVKYLEKENLLKYIRFFRVAEKDLI